MDTHDDDVPFAGEYLDFAEMGRDELQAKLFELLTLVETSRELLRARDADDVARRVLLSSIGVLGAGSACVLLQSGDALALGPQLGLDPAPRLRLRPSRSLTEAFREETSPRPVRADVVCPLVGREGLLGFLILGRRLLAEGYTARDLDLFASLAELYVLALERAPHLNPSVADVAPGPAATGIRPRSEGDNVDLLRLRGQYPPLAKIMGESDVMASLFGDLVEFADSRATILIQGESGTGKELVAKAIHELSRRRNGPLEIVDCSSIPKELIESELFGHMRGAFTGAVRDRRGAFDLAHHGTIFLDEIGDMTLSSQTRLLRVLQEGKFRPVGGEKQHSVDVRVIAATNVDLREAVRRGEFRKDLFFRIQVFPVRLPPLRERRGDVEVLTRAFLKRFFADDGLPAPDVDPEVFAELDRYAFPGNVRELQNMTEALAIRSRAVGRVTLDALHDVFASMNIRLDGRTPVSAFDAESSDRDDPRPARDVLPVRSVMPDSMEGLDTGQKIVQAWRQSSFNLLEASRRLRARKLDGDDIAVVDRAQMSHYLDGEILQAFLEEGGLAGAVERLAGSHASRHRAARRVKRVIQQLALAAERGEPHRAFPRLPNEYRDAVRRLGDLGGAWIQRGLAEPIQPGRSRSS